MANSEADADHVKVKTEMLQLRLMEKRRELVRIDEVNELIDGALRCGTDASVEPACTLCAAW
jgi:hypothetical protein